MDLSIPLDKRIEFMQIYYKEFGELETLEHINRLSMMYQFSGTKLLEEYLYNICINTNLSVILKLSAAKSLCWFNKTKEVGYIALNHICQNKENMKNVPTPCQIECVCILMENKEYKTQSKTYFCNIINNINLDCDYRYKTILSLETKNIPHVLFFISESLLDFFYNSKNMTLYRILAGQYLIQKCTHQPPYSKEGEKILDTEFIQFTLLSFSQDPDLDYDLRADAADVILRLGSDDNKIEAKKLIMALGSQKGIIRTVFDNAQNVHIEEIEDSVVKILEFISTLDLMIIGENPTEQCNDPSESIQRNAAQRSKGAYPKESASETRSVTRSVSEGGLRPAQRSKGAYPKESASVGNEVSEGGNEVSKGEKEKKKASFISDIFPMTNTPKKKEKNKNNITHGRIPINFEYVKKQLDNLLKADKQTKNPIYSKKQLKNIEISLNRIYLDRALYSKYNCTLSNILLKIWSYINNNEHQNEMKTRLLQELIDMSGTCSTGFAGRLINSITGFGEFNLTISYRDQIIANLNGRLNSRIHKINDEEFKDQILEEMTICTNDFGNRINFLKFFRENMLSIREELYEEFKNHIQDVDFDLYFRCAIAVYETGGYV
jgi:hypothetical protein